MTTTGQDEQFEHLLRTRSEELGGTRVGFASPAPTGPAARGVLEHDAQGPVLEYTFRDYLETFWRRRLVFLVVFAVVAGIGSLYVLFFFTPTYTARGMLQRERPSDAGAMAGLAGLKGSRLNEDAAKLRAEAVGWTAAKLFRDYVNTRRDLVAAEGSSAFQLADVQLDAAQWKALAELSGEQLLGLVEVLPDDKRGILEVKCTDPVRGVSIAVVNVVIYAFLEQDRLRKEGAIQDRLKSIKEYKDRALPEIKRESEEIERKRGATIREGGRILLTEEERRRLKQRITREQDQVRALELGLTALKRQLQVFKKQRATRQVSPGVTIPLGDARIREWKTTLSRKRDERREKSVEFTEENEIIRNLNQQISDLEAQISKREDDLRAGRAEVEESPGNRVRETLTNNISGLEAKIQSEESLLLEKRADLDKLIQEAASSKPNVDLDFKISRQEALKGTLEHVEKAQADAELSSSVTGETYRVHHWARDAERSSSTNVLLGTVGLAFFMALGVLFLREQLSDEITTPVAASHLLELPVSGRLPNFRMFPGGILPFDDRSSPEAEIVAILRESIRVNCASTGSNVITIVSPSRGEGKSFISVNMALSFTHSGNRTVLVNTDLRGPDGASIAHLFGGKAPPVGLTQFLQGEASEDDIQHSTPIGDFWVIPCGVPGGNAWKLLSSEKMPALLEELSQRFEIVLLDTAGLMAVADVSAFAKYVGNIFFVIREGRTSKHSALQALHRLTMMSSNVRGIVYNGTRIPIDSYSYYYTRSRGA